MYLTSILHSCEFVKVDPPAVPTVICIVGGPLFSLSVVGRRYMDFDKLSATPELLSLFFLVVGVTDFE